MKGLLSILLRINDLLHSPMQLSVTVISLLRLWHQKSKNHIGSDKILSSHYWPTRSHTRPCSIQSYSLLHRREVTGEQSWTPLKTYLWLYVKLQVQWSLFFFLSPSLVCQLLRQISGKLVLGKCLTFFTNHWFMSLSNALKSSSSSSSSLICVSSVAGHSLTGSSTVFGFVLSG